LGKYPNSLSLRNWYGPLLARSGREEEAIQVLQEAARLYPQDDACLISLGGIYLSAGKAEEARRFFEDALVRDADSRMAHKQLGMVFANHLVNPAKAVEHFKKYLELGGDSDAPKWKAYISIHEPHLKKPQ
jgi:tetratricopeptide (TPR) repeat protein